MKRLIPLILSAFLLGSMPAYAAPDSLSVQVSVPAGGSVPKGAQRVPLLVLSMEASCEEDVTIEELVVRHGGLGDENDLTNVYVTDGTRRLSRAVSFSGADKIARLRIGSLTIEKCEKKTVIVVVDFSSDAASGSQHRLSIEKDGIVSTADNVSITNTAGKPVTTVPGNIGRITVMYPALTRAVSYGANRTVGRLSFEADNVSDHEISAITLTNNGSAQGTDLKNLRLRLSNGEYVGSSETSLDGDTVRFEFDPPLLLERNQTRLLNVIADIRASRRRTIQLEVEESSDIEATVRKQRGGRFQ
jgi:hypothetical protein